MYAVVLPVAASAAKRRHSQIQEPPNAPRFGDESGGQAMPGAQARPTDPISATKRVVALQSTLHEEHNGHVDRLWWSEDDAPRASPDGLAAGRTHVNVRVR